MAEEMTATTIVESLKALIAKLGGEGADESTIVEALKTIYVTLGGEDDVSEIDTIVEMLNKVTEVVTISSDEDFIGIIEGTLSTIENSAITNIASYAFYGKGYIKNIDLPMVESVGQYAFALAGIESVKLPKAKQLQSYVFASTLLTNVSLPEASLIGHGAFVNAFSLQEIYLPKLKSVADQMFQECRKLSIVSLPEAINMGSNAFYGCSLLNSLYLPKAESIPAYCFQNCTSLTEISLPAVKSIYTYAFSSCAKLISLYLGGSSVVNLINKNAFTNTPISQSVAGEYGSIFVPASLYNDYIVTAGWSAFSARFVSM